MKNNLSILLLMAAGLLVSVAASAQDETSAGKVSKGLEPDPYAQIVNVDSRSKVCLDGIWRTIVDPYQNGYFNYRLLPLNDGSSYFADKDFYADQTKLVEYNFDSAATLMVPGDWNTQKEKLYYYEGAVWYRKKFDYQPKEGMRTFLYFGAANYEAVVGLNGKKIGRHTGGYTPFNFEVTDRVKAGENSVVAMVVNKRYPEGVPTVNSDWWNYGGITRNVYLLEVPSTFIREYNVQLQKGPGRLVSGWVQLDGAKASQTVKISVPELGVGCEAVTDDKGYAAFEFKLGKKAQLWCPENPKLYDVAIEAETDSVNDRIGFRTIEVNGTDILLNGRKIFCRGVAVHDEAPGAFAGRAWSREHAATTLGWAKEMGCNFVRLAHYPHNENMLRMADEMGIMVWSEVPVYWTIHWNNPDTYANAEQQLVDMITRDRNRASIVIWSVANETPRSPERLAFLRKLVDKAHSMDDTRLVSAAMEKSRLADGRLTVNDELAPYVDLMSFNQYVGWYDGTSEKCESVEWTFDIQKPVFISEFGGGALYNYHGKVTDRFTEEYLEDLYEKNIKMLERIPGLAGTTPWILKDFRSPRRKLSYIQDDYNRKGLISEQGMKKKAFYVMQRWYRELEEKFAQPEDSRK